MFFKGPLPRLNRKERARLALRHPCLIGFVQRFEKGTDGLAVAQVLDTPSREFYPISTPSDYKNGLQIFGPAGEPITDSGLGFD